MAALLPERRPVGWKLLAMPYDFRLCQIDAISWKSILAPGRRAADLPQR